jgi:MFS family permease
VEQLYVTIGIIGGYGLSAAYIVGLLSVERWFEKRRTFAIGIVSAGTGFGTFILPPVTQYLLDIYEWRTTMIFMSTLMAFMTIVGNFIDDPQWKIDEKNLKISRKSLSLVHFKNVNFTLLAISTFVIYALYNVPIYFMVKLLKDFDYTELHAANYLSLTGFSLMIGMVALGWLGDYSGPRIRYVNALCVLICGISEALMPIMAPNFITFGLCCAFFGFTFASAYVLIPKIAEMIVGVDSFASALGVNFLIQGCGLLLGTPFASLLYESLDR